MNVGGTMAVSASGDVVFFSSKYEIPNSAGQKGATCETRDEAFLSFFFFRSLKHKQRDCITPTLASSTKSALLHCDK